MKVNKKLCMKCGGCVSVCPVNCLELQEGGIVFGKECTKCGSCKKFCPVGAISDG